MSYKEINSLSGLLVLIDIDKVFDSVSWSFLSGCYFLGFGNNIIKLVKILNTVFKDSIQYWFQYFILKNVMLINKLDSQKTSEGKALKEK